jgi:arylsulfatase A-like enzyme
VLGSYQSEKHRAESQTYVALADARGLTGKKKMAFLRKNYKPSTEKADVPDNYYYDGRIANDALKRIDEFAEKDKPFLLMVGFKKPHLPFVAPSKYWDLYDPDKLNLAKWQRHSKGGPSIAYHNNGELRSYTDIPAAFDDGGLLDREKQRELIHGYYAATSYIDTQIGKLLDRLKEKGLLDNTIIVLWGDHGWHLGDHGLWCKHTNFEQATKAPLIFIAPGMSKGKHASTMAEFVDIFPTLIDYAGFKVPPYLEGESLVSVLKDPDVEVKDYALSQFFRGADIMGYTMRTGRYRITLWMKGDYKHKDLFRDPVIDAVELYDYETDPQERVSLATDPAYASIVEELKTKLLGLLNSEADKFEKTGF